MVCRGWLRRWLVRAWPETSKLVCVRGAYFKKRSAAQTLRRWPWCAENGQGQERPEEQRAHVAPERGILSPRRGGWVAKEEQTLLNPSWTKGVYIAGRDAKPRSSQRTRSARAGCSWNARAKQSSGGARGLEAQWYACQGSSKVAMPIKGAK